MPKPNHNNIRSNSHQSQNVRERTLLECKPNIALYADNFIAKIIVIFLMAFLFAPMIALFAVIQENLMTTFQLNISNLTSIMEIVYLFCMLIVIIKIVLDVLDWRATTYTLTDSKVIIQRGFVHKENISMPYHKIGDMEISQSILERILNAGDVILYGGHDNSETILYDIPNPKDVGELITENMDRYSYNQQAYNPNYNQQYQNPNRQYQNQNYNQQYYDPNYNQQYQNNNYGYGQYDNRDYPYSDNGYNNRYQNRNSQNQQEQYSRRRSNNQYRDNSYEEKDSKYNQFKNKWDKNKSSKKRVDEEQIIEKHQQMFKKTRKQ